MREYQSFTSDPEQPLNDRLRVRVLLDLQDISLMQAVLDAKNASGEKMDYGNVSAWMRDIPGRMSEQKVRVFLAHLGLVQGRLDTHRIHRWTLAHDAFQVPPRLVQRLLTESAAWPQRYVWLSTTHGAKRALAMQAGDATLLMVFEQHQGMNEQDMLRWLHKMGLDGTPETCDFSAKSEAFWQALERGEINTPSVIWSKEESSDEARWDEVLKFAQHQALHADDVLILLNAALRLKKPDESVAHFQERVNVWCS